jgi:hypothetical protein
MLNRRERILGGAILGAALLFVLLPNAQMIHASRTRSQAEEPVPAFHAKAPTTLPDTLDPSQFANPVVKNAYAAAAKVKRVLYQQPCYCHCDRSQGHGSLLDCFTSAHGSGCNVCIGEALYAYEQTRKGKSAAQIREGIEKGEWQKIDGARYQTYPAKP